MKGKHFLALLAAVLAVCCLVLGLGGKKTGGTLPTPAAGSAAPRQTEPTGKLTEAAGATTALSAEEITEAPETETTAETTAAASAATAAEDTIPAAETETARPGTEASTAAPETRPAGEEKSGQDYVANKNTLKFHYPSCSSVAKMKESNRWDFHGTREELIAKGYVPCKRCGP